MSSTLTTLAEELADMRSQRSSKWAQMAVGVITVGFLGWVIVTVLVRLWTVLKEYWTDAAASADGKAYDDDYQPIVSEPQRANTLQTIQRTLDSQDANIQRDPTLRSVVRTRDNTIKRLEGESAVYRYVASVGPSVLSARHDDYGREEARPNEPGFWTYMVSGA